MSHALSWQATQRVLSLSGVLDSASLLPFWQQRQQLLHDIDVLDLSELSRIDSAGVAMLVHLRHASDDVARLAIRGISPALRSLLALYNLQEIIPDQASTAEREEA